MGFMTAPSGGEFTPYVSFNAKAGRWYTKLVDDKDAEIEEVGNMLAVFDFADLKTGWFRFAAKGIGNALLPLCPFFKIADRLF
jgi:hypothetical protein